jgi:gluconate 2-dehydrogenase gamma chain
MSSSQLSRRKWLAASPFGAGSALIAAHWPQILAAQEHAHQAMRSAKLPSLSVLGPVEAREIEAIASQIIPTDTSPGAREAGVIYFIDGALATFDRHKRDLYTKGLALAQAKRAAMFPRSESIAALRPEEQAGLLHAIENTDFFEQVRIHCIMGFFGNPSYGGNRDLVGWKLIGFEDRFHFEPPFGYYDGPGGAENER